MLERDARFRLNTCTSMSLRWFICKFRSLTAPQGLCVGEKREHFSLRMRQNLHVFVAYGGPSLGSAIEYGDVVTAKTNKNVPYCG
jgi:hypothetical protein